MRAFIGVLVNKVIKVLQLLLFLKKLRVDLFPDVIKDFVSGVSIFMSGPSPQLIEGHLLVSELDEQVFVCLIQSVIYFISCEVWSHLWSKLVWVTPMHFQKV